MQTLTKSLIINQLLNHKEQIRQCGIARLGLFGSYVREQQTENSDIDIYIEFAEKAENFDNFMQICFLLDDLFSEKRVEVVTQNGLSPYIGAHILNEVQYVQIAD